MERGELGGDLTRLAAMHLRQFVIVLAGTLTTLFCILAILTPLTTSGFPYWDRLGSPPPRVELALTPSVVLPASTSRVSISSCAWYDPFYIVGYWDPTPGQIAALERELPVFLGAFTGHYAHLDSTMRAAAADARQYVGISRFIEGDIVMVTGLDLGEAGGEVDHFIDRCRDSAWRWSAEFDPRDGRFIDIDLSRSGE